MKLVIVESPAKCKKIESFLGKGYKVIASYGHFRKLNSLKQIDFETFQTKFKNDKMKIINVLKEETKKADDVYLATDDDREGEAIAWHICDVCKLNVVTTKRIVFQEITKPAVLNAVKSPRTIDMNKVNSQLTRQILDLLVGFKISPILWKNVQSKLSAGRCQTPALKLIYENEESFKSQSFETHFTIKAFFGNKHYEFKLDQYIDKQVIEEFLMNHNESYQFEIKKPKQKKVSSPTPLTTSSLQQKCSTAFKMSPKITMKHAQTLYENGLITYMRTDSTKFSKEFVKLGVNYVKNTYGEQFVSSSINKLSTNKSKSKTQDAHEAIRVTKIETTPDMIRLDNGCKKVYTLIRNNTLESLMSDCVYNSTLIHIPISFQNKTMKYERSIDLIQFIGWKIIQNPNFERDNTTLNGVLSYFKNIKDKQVTLHYVDANEGLINTLSHYSESSLIKVLETKNIGRPSTYASIMDSLQTRKYVTKGNISGKDMKILQIKYSPKDEKLSKVETNKSMNSENNRLKITPLGSIVIEFIYEHFDSLFNYDFTNLMELKLDEISNGDETKNETLSEYKREIDEQIKSMKVETSPKKKQTNALSCGSIDGNEFSIKHGPYGYYLSLGERKKSLNGYKEVNIIECIETQSISDDQIQRLLIYMNETNPKYYTLNPNLSIRNGKYGEYIFYKTPKMKKPKFYKLPFKTNPELETMVREKNTEKLLEYIKATYDVI